MICLMTLSITSCKDTGNKNSDKKQVSQQETPTNFEKGRYGYDLQFLKNQNIKVVELINETTKNRVMIIPDWQGRVMTSSADGKTGNSFGWINYDLISSKKISDQFNPFGGEERFWLGPEGGPFSIYFPQGKEQVFQNWKVPASLDTEAFEVVESNKSYLRMKKNAELLNASGNSLKIDITRKVRLLSSIDITQQFGFDIPDDLKTVAFESENSIINSGNEDWNAQHGFVSIWLLSMFNPSEEGVVFIPVSNQDAVIGKKYITDDYFGKVPSERLKLISGILFFKVDGRKRSKIGIAPEAASSFSGSYDPIKKVVTIVWFEKPKEDVPYVNSIWGEQENPLKGDAINSYNDGPVEDGSIMGPFYELETSSPAALLSRGETITHKQRIYHIQGEEKDLEVILQRIFNLKIEEIKAVF